MKEGIAREVNDSTQTLILGSFPGEKSLELKQYYANPNNRLWKDVFKVKSKPYNERISYALSNNIGFWDVINFCEREGSSDSKIIWNSIKINNFSELFKKFPNIKKILLNGKFAEKCFNELVKKDLIIPQDVVVKCLPSTSPLNAKYFKLETWTNELNLNN